MSFEFPEFLWLLPLCALVWLVPAKSTGRSSRTHELLRVAVMLGLLLGLARPVIVNSAWTDHHVVIVDRTASAADPLAAELALQKVAAALPKDGVRVLVEVGGSDASSRTTKAFDQQVAIRGESSPLGAALQRALRAIPEGAGGAVTVISDGLATDSRWQRAMQELTARGLPLHAISLAHDDADVRLVGVTLLDELRVGHVGRVRIAVAGAAANIKVTLTADGEPVAESREVACQGVATIELPIEPKEAGYVALQATVARTDANDTDETNNTMQRTVAVQDPLRVLYLGSRVRGAAAHLQQLLGSGFELQEPNRGEPLDLERTDLTMLDDRPASEMPASWQQQVADAVQTRGMGLLVSGGKSAFGPGGYHNTVIETISPVEYIQKEEKKDPSTTLSIVIDTSGSMVGNRMTLAKEVARLAIRRLQPHDKVGIVEFYGTKQWAAPIQSAANSIDLQRALNRLGAAGGTVLFPAVEESYYALKNVQTRYKHVLIVTDAGVETGPYEALLRKMSDDGIAVSTVLVGPGRHSEFLVELADWGGGRYYHSPDRFNLPELLLKKPSTSMLPPYRPGDYQIEVHGGRGWWGDVETDKIPPVQTLVETSLRSGADQLLSVAGSGRPVLASWQYGLGRVTSLCTEPVGPGTVQWGKWDGYGPMLGRVLSRTSRSAQPPFEFALQRTDSHLHVVARRQVRTDVVPTITTDDDAELALAEIAPGVFRGSMVAAATATVRLQAAGIADGRHRLVSDVLAAQSPESQVDPRAAMPLAEIADATGGVHVPDGAAVPGLPVRRTGSPLHAWPLWPWLLLLALLAYLLDVLHRRRATDAQGVA